MLGMPSAHDSAEPAPVAGSRFAQHVQAIAEIATQWSDYSLQTAMCQMDADRPEGDLLIGLCSVYAATGELPVWLHLARIRYLNMEDAFGPGDFIAEVKISFLPAERSAWPVEARAHELRSWDGEWGKADSEIEMVWVEIDGPWWMEAIAQIIDVSVVPPQLEPFYSPD